MYRGNRIYEKQLTNSSHWQVVSEEKRIKLFERIKTYCSWDIKDVEVYSKREAREIPRDNWKEAEEIERHSNWNCKKINDVSHFWFDLVVKI